MALLTGRACRITFAASGSVRSISIDPTYVACAAAGCAAAAASAVKISRSVPLPSAYPAPTPEEWRYRFQARTATASCRRGKPNATPLTLDQEAVDWQRAHSSLPVYHTLGSTILKLVGYAPYDAQALLDLPAVHLLSTSQWRSLLFEDGRGEGQGHALDVGAGCGHVTEKLLPLFASVGGTEASDWLTWRLKKKGINAAHTLDPTDATALASAGLPASYDVVFALHLLDRVDQAKAFLRSLVNLLRPDGRLVVALPLPYHAVGFLHPLRNL